MTATPTPLPDKDPLSPSVSRNTRGGYRRPVTLGGIEQRAAGVQKKTRDRDDRFDNRGDGLHDETEQAAQQTTFRTDDGVRGDRDDRQAAVERGEILGVHDRGHRVDRAAFRQDAVPVRRQQAAHRGQRAGLHANDHALRLCGSRIDSGLEPAVELAKVVRSLRTLRDGGIAERSKGHDDHHQVNPDVSTENFSHMRVSQTGNRREDLSKGRSTLRRNTHNTGKSGLPNDLRPDDDRKRSILKNAQNRASVLSCNRVPDMALANSLQRRWLSEIVGFGTRCAALEH